MKSYCGGGLRHPSMCQVDARLSHGFFISHRFSLVGFDCGHYLYFADSLRISHRVYTVCAAMRNSIDSIKSE